MNLNSLKKQQFLSAEFLRSAEAVLNVGQKQWKKTVNLSRDHGKQLLDDSKAFYQDLMDLQVKSVREIRKAWDNEPVHAAAPRKQTKARTKKKAKKN